MEQEQYRNQENDTRISQTEKEWDEQEHRGEPTVYEQRHYDFVTALHAMPAQQIAEVLRDTDPRIINIIKEVITEM